MVSAPPRRVLIASHYATTGRLYDSNSYETIWGIEDCDLADVVAPPQENRRWRRKWNKIRVPLAKRTGIGYPSWMKTIEIERDYELFIYVASVLPSLGDLARIKQWRKHARRAVCILLKAFSNELDRGGHYLRLLADFDIVYTATYVSKEKLDAMVRPPVKYFALCVPSLEMSLDTSSERFIDVYAMGRRLPQLHDQLLPAAKRGKLIYLYDSVHPHSPFVLDFSDHVFMRTQLLRNTKFLATFGIQSFNSVEMSIAKDEDMINTRYLEGAATGAVMFGTTPTSPEYPLLFDWEDVVIPAPVEGCDYLAFVRALESDTDRMSRIRRRNELNALLKLDVAYRYEAILRDLELEPSEKLAMRKERLRLAAEKLRDG
jgi:hypothetical protein